MVINLNITKTIDDYQLLTLSNLIKEKYSTEFITEDNDKALEKTAEIKSISSTLRKAQSIFNKWGDLEDNEKTTEKLLDMLNFDYFKLLDSLTIARSRKHIEKYYNINDIGQFPKRLKPENVKEDIDTLDKDEVAKAVAKQSADVTFKANYANIGFDIIQFYALRNIGFSGFRKSKVSASARRLDINSRRFAGKYKTMAELEELVANQSLKRKAADKIGDFLYTGRTVFLAEASEGVEGKHLGGSSIVQQARA